MRCGCLAYAGPTGAHPFGLNLRRIFDRNQEEFTKAEPKTIPTIAVVEEAQAVLNERSTASEPYIAWIKEGRKYDLGALLITQQPGSIPVDILSQGDNWFIFHLLSSADLTTLQRANAHFSGDILSVLLNEPIPGQGVFWSSVGGKPYPVSLRVLSFEQMYRPLDLHNTRSAIETYAQQLKREFEKALEERLEVVSVLPPALEGVILDGDSVEAEPVDVMSVYKTQAIEALRRNAEFLAQMRSGIPWGGVLKLIMNELPQTIEEHERSEIAYRLVREAIEAIFGSENEGWYTQPGPKRGGGSTTWVKAGKRS